uniref:Uncharacterized protein n=1 Tax=Phytophthora ramorum TaxID=164328 RepID=H3GC11_PHYRM
MPLDPAHLLEGMEAGSIFEMVHNGATKANEAGIFCPPDQCAVELATYYIKLGFPRDQAYVWKSEYWLQVGNRESAIHVDHGRVVSYIPPGVRIQRPGDVVCLINLVFHFVLLAYQPGTAAEDRWGGIFGDVIVCATDRIESFRYAAKVASGSKKWSRKAWEPLLSAYSTMEEGGYDLDNYEQVLNKFLSELKLDEQSEKARVRAAAKADKKRKKNQKMEKPIGK